MLTFGNDDLSLMVKILDEYIELKSMEENAKFSTDLYIARKQKETMEKHLSSETCWVAQFNAKDDAEREIIKLGIRPCKSNFGIFFSDSAWDMQMCESTKEKAIELVKKSWGTSKTFQWLNN